ncbi:universal stress protein [Streptomyces sp. NPDC005811]|uniref:universal stress protein n=1 Tax=Streptomyces sp. NPDC005811 TaxID=3154565 RepID=UPI0033E53ED3
MREPVVLACVDRSARGRSAAEWAEGEARLRSLPLRIVAGPPSDAMPAKMIVCGVPSRADTAGRPPGPSRLPPAVVSSDRPLVLVPDGAPSPHGSGKVVLGVDARAPSGGAIDFAFDSARVHGARLHVVHAWSLPPAAARWPFGVPEKERAELEDHEVQLLADALRPWRGDRPEVPVLEDVLLLAPAEALLHHAGRAALVVVGRAPGADWGEVVGTLLREAPCPVAVVPARPTVRGRPRG